MRYTAARAGLGLVLAASALAVTGAGTASAEPAPADRGPSALVLTVSEGESAASSSATRAATLSCSPALAGDHPAPEAACEELTAARGDFTSLSGDSSRVCPQIYDPVVVTADGIWQGKRVTYEQTYANTCVLEAETGQVFAF
ncbi:protease inhibitor [Streptomyces capparidis]